MDGSILTPVIGALSGLAGVVVGAWLTGRAQRVERGQAWRLRQLAEFYGPMLGLRYEIRAKSEARVKVHGAADAAWRELCARVEGNPAAAQKMTEERDPDFAKLIDYDNQQLRDVILPLYREMIAVFRKNIALAEPETRVHFDELIAFMDLWDRVEAESLPKEAVKQLGHSETPLHALYADLEEKVDWLNSELAAGGPNEWLKFAKCSYKAERSRSAG